MNDYHKFILDLSDDVREYRKRQKRIAILKTHGWKIIEGIIIAVIAGLILNYCSK